MAMPEMEEVKDLALKFDKQTLGRMAQMGQVSPTLAVMAGMMRDRIVQSEMKPPEQTVAEEVMQPMGQRMGLAAAQQMPQQAPQMPQQGGQGLDRIPVPEAMFDERRMAGGGIVAFQAGGAAPSFANMFTELGPDLEALAAARKAYMGDFPTESPEERERRRREENAMRLMEIGLGIAGGESPYFASNLKGALPGIRGAAEDVKARRKEELARTAAERAEKGKVFEGVLGMRQKAAEATAAKERADADREAQIKAANIAAGKPTDLRYYAQMKLKAEKGDQEAKTIVGAIDNYLQLSALPRLGVAQQQAGIQQQRVDVDLYDKAVAYAENQIARGGPKYTEYRALQKQDKENAAKGNPTNLAGEFETNLQNKYMQGARPAGQAQPGAAPQGAGTKESPLPMPKTAAEAVAGKVYMTARGPARWNGKEFVPVQ